MAGKKNYFDISISFIIILLFIWNAFFMKIIEDYFGSIKAFWYTYVFFILLAQSFMILYLINMAYKSPIDDLIKVINETMSWWSKWKNIFIKNDSHNPNIKFIINFFDYILNSIKNIKSEFLSWKAIKWEVQLATEIQEKLLLKKIEPIPSLEVVAKSKPAWEIWWDSFDIIKEWDNYYIYVWDATWHWVWAWFVMVMVNALVSWFAKVFKSWAQILANTNEILKPRVKSNILMTVLMVRWDEVQKRLFMTGAGHEYLVIYKHKLNKCFLLKSWWMALWMTKNIHKVLKEQEIKFEINDIMVLYTDWITEAINQNKKDWNEKMFWEQKILDAIISAPNIVWTDIKTATSVFNNITIELSKFMWYQHVQLDDITLVVAHYRWLEPIKNDFSKDIEDDFITEWYWNK